MIATLQPSPLDQWRQRFGGRRRRNRRPRPLAALGYLAHGPVIEGLIEVEKLLLIVLYDAPTGHGQHALRLAGYSGTRVPWGVKWGGAEQCRFLKNLLLQPVPNGPGLRLSTASTDSVAAGAATGPRFGEARSSPVAARAATAPLAVSLGRIQAGRRRHDHRRRAGTGGILPSHRQGQLAVAGRDSARILRPFALPASRG